jgi:polyhydroxybutyrate depolymerase
VLRRRASLIGLVAGLVVIAFVAVGCQDRRSDRRTVSAPTTSGAPATATGPAACDPGRTRAPGQAAEKLTFEGVERNYLLYIPKTYTGRTPTPLLFNFHGFGSSAEQQMVYGDFRPIAEREGFPIVALDGQGAARHFNLFAASPTEQDDVAVTLALLDKLQADLCIDQKRVFSTGMSDGGAMSGALACRASDRFAAIGPVAVLLYLPQCDGAARAMPVAGFMGTADPVVPFDGGRVNCCGNPTLPSALDSMTKFAVHAGCAPTPAEERVSSMVLLRRWSGCKAGAAVDFYAVEGGGHTWPGSPIDVGRLGATTKEISASETLWTFFQQHPLP